MSDATLASMARRGSGGVSFDQAVRRGEARRLALAIRSATSALALNRDQLTTGVEQLAPGLTRRVGIGPVSAAQTIVSWSHPGRCRNDATNAPTTTSPDAEGKSDRDIRRALKRYIARELFKALEHTA